ncbi:MAG TPA: ribosome biogenesis GTP-binding protein YihA/YsxC [bacterium]|nr:ribosome biogenesis GTP-binding protein YihA/YsxC [bacterium]
MIQIKSADFIISAGLSAHFPPGGLPECAFIGRSNVGKSSLMNMLLGRKQLVKTSKTPGKTVTINFFLVNGIFHFVDLPGYGFAKRSKSELERWREAIEDYLTTRTELKLILLLIDGRHGLQKSDEQMVEFLSHHRLPWIPVFTKIDKLTNNEKARLRRHSPDTVCVSSVTGEGKEEAWTCIERHLL